MWRFVAGVMSALMLVAAGMFWWKSMARADDPIPAPRDVPNLIAPNAAIDAPPAATEKTREEKRFNRYDKDRNTLITREEYLASRRKAWTKLDRNGDGKLSFEEWSVRTVDKFANADADRSGTLTPKEFATTKVVRAAKVRCTCNDSVQD